MQRIVLLSLAGAVCVFCAVQDRTTAAGARRYVAEQRAALASGSRPVAVGPVMERAIRQSVQQGLSWGSVVFFAGVAGGTLMRRRRGE